MRSFFTSVLWSSASQVTAAGASLLVGVITARVLGPEGRGLYATFFFTAGLAATMLRMGLHEGIVYFYNRKMLSLGLLVGNCLVYLVGCGLLVLAATGLLTSQAVLGLTPDLLKSLAVAIVMLVTIETLGGFLMALHKYDHYAVNTVVQTLAILGASAMLFVVPTAGIEEAINWRVVATAAGVLIPLYFVIQIARRFAIHVKGEVLASQLWFGSKSTVQLVIGLLNFKSYLYLLVLFVGADAAGAFSVALLYVEVVRFAPNAIGMVLFPALTRADEATELDGMMARASRNLMFVTLVTVVIAVAAVPVATPLVFGGEYADTIFGTCVMLIGSAFGVGFQVFSRYFTSRHLQHYNIAIACLGLLAAIACSLILIPALGFEGAAWAFLVGQLAMGALPILAFLRISRRNIHEVLVIDGRDLVYLRDSFRRLLTRTS